MPETFLARFPGDPREKFSSQLGRSRGFRLRPKVCRPSANTENSRRTREKPLVLMVRRASRIWYSRNWLIYFLEREDKQTNWSWANNSGVKDSAHCMLKAMPQRNLCWQGNPVSPCQKLRKIRCFFFLLLFITMQAVSKFIALIPCRSNSQMMVNFSGVEFERAVSCSHSSDSFWTCTKTISEGRLLFTHKNGLG